MLRPSEFWGLYSGTAQDSSLLRCYAMSPGTWVQTFRHIEVHAFLSLLLLTALPLFQCQAVQDQLLDNVDEGTQIRGNFGKQWSKDAAWQPEGSHLLRNGFYHHNCNRMTTKTDWQKWKKVVIPMLQTYCNEFRWFADRASQDNLR